MAVDGAKPDLRVIKAYLDDVGVELDAARRLAEDPPNRLAAFHLQQAAEKLVKAVRLHRGLYATAGHSLEVLVDELPDGDEWREKLTQLEPLSAYATTYRYPSPGGGRKTGPGKGDVLAWVERIEELSNGFRNTLTRPAGR